MEGTEGQISPSVCRRAAEKRRVIIMNILWICTDQQRMDTLGCYGNTLVHTPNLDRLSSLGVRFTNTYSQCPVCAPSRGSFLTGRYPRTCGVRQNGQDIDDRAVLLPRLLKEHGYFCGLSGKLHLSSCHDSVCKTMDGHIIRRLFKGQTGR